jgi:hypothetical protein
VSLLIAVVEELGGVVHVRVDHAEQPREDRKGPLVLELKPSVHD